MAMVAIFVQRSISACVLILLCNTVARFDVNERYTDGLSNKKCLRYEGYMRYMCDFLYSVLHVLIVVELNRL